MPSLTSRVHQIGREIKPRSAIVVTVCSLLAAFLIFVPAECFANTKIVSVEVTQMQAKITVETDQDGYCRYRASRGTVFSENLPDIDDNGDTDKRLGSLMNGRTHVFVLGTRKGSDALATAANYWLAVSCGADGEVSTSFKTLTIPLGNFAPDPVPFDRGHFGNMDYPVIDWNNVRKSYVDPVEGVEFWRLTGPGMIGASSYTAQYNQTTSPPVVLGRSNAWLNAANAAANGKSYATATSGPGEKLFIPLSPHIFYDGAGGWLSRINVDDVLTQVYCGNASGSGAITLTLQFTLDGGRTAVGKPITTIPCPHGKTTKVGTYPGVSPQALFRGWGMKAPQHNLVVPPFGKVTVANRVVTLESAGASNNYFVTDWPSGTPVRINDKYYFIQTVESPTRLTLTEDTGTQIHATYEGANSGIVVFKNGPGSVDVSLGVDIFGSSLPDNGLNGTVPMVNPAAVMVSRAADGRTRLAKALKGYLAYLVDQSGGGSIILWIPYNADGSMRNESRLLSANQKPASSPRMHGGGDEFRYDVGLRIRAGAVFDGSDGKTWFATDMEGVRLFRATYDEALPGCAGFPAYNPYPNSGGYHYDAFAKDDCFQWRNLTPSHAKPAMDIRSQMTRAYQSGRNTRGETVGAAHPNFDLGWFGQPISELNSGGFFTVTIANSREHLAIFAAFDTSTGVIKAIKNMWGGDGDSESRWGGLHSVGLGAGNWRFATMNSLDDNNEAPGREVFNSAFDLPIVRVNRAGYGAAARWDDDTSLKGKEAYKCPANLPVRYAGLAGTSNCVEVKVSTPPCNASPDSTYKFPDGKTEKEEFPCSTPGFGIADANRSKLMNIQAGDWLRERRAGAQNEAFVALTVSYNGTNDIDLWLLRWARHNYLLPLFKNMDDKQPERDVRTNGWFLSMAPSLNAGPASMAIDLSAGSSAKWLPDTPQRASCHGTFGPGLAEHRYTYTESCDPPTYRGNLDMPLQGMVFQPLVPLRNVASYPGFAGSNAGASAGLVQSYGNSTWLRGAARPPYRLDFRHLNPSYGAGAEVLNSYVGSPRALTRVPGTVKSFQIEDKVSSGASDYKRLPLFGYAGHYLLQDVSAPNSGNSADLPDYSVCRAIHSGECFANSKEGNLYVSVPQAYVDEQCRSNQFTLAAPCAFQLAPFTGQVVQFRLDQKDAKTAGTRKLGYVHGMPGLQYQFSNCRATPDADFAFCMADWLDGVRSEWVVLRLGALTEAGGVDRTSFVPVPITFQRGSSFSYARVRFGYSENGPSLLCCTPYQAECTSEIAKRAPGDPYSFINEKVTRQSCPEGATCTLSISAISNRMLYYVVDRLDWRGAILSSDAMQVVAVP